METCCNSTKRPYQIPGYAGEVPGHRFRVGQTYSKGTHDALVENLLRPGPKGCFRRPTMYPDPCRGHEADLRARFHLLHGDIDRNVCAGTDWNSRNRFCIQKPIFECPPKLTKMNQHGYLSRLSVYQSPDLSVMACKATNTAPCKTQAPSGKPFWQEYEDLTNYDPFQEYPPECRHLRLPKLKYKQESCWDDEFYIPVEAEEDYRRLGYIKPPRICDCLPLDPKKDDKDVKFYRHEPDPRRFQFPTFADPSSPYRYFISGYTGHVPTEKLRFGDSFVPSTRKALNKFTKNYLEPHLLAKCPQYFDMDPSLYCDDEIDVYDRFCDRRKSYDGHFHEKPIRDRLKPEFDPKNCPKPMSYEAEPFPICIQANAGGN